MIEMILSMCIVISTITGHLPGKKSTQKVLKNEFVCLQNSKMVLKSIYQLRSTQQKVPTWH